MTRFQQIRSVHPLNGTLIAGEKLVRIGRPANREQRENGDRGTDHGHGSVYWVMGGGINGGRILGEQVKVDQPTLFQNRDYPVLTDYRAMFAGLLGRMYGLDGAAVQRVFTGVHPAELGLV